MTAELKKCLTIIFRRKGKDMLGEQEFVYAASMDLHWFPPKDAQKLLDIAMREGLLKMSQGMLSPAFDIADDNIDFDYRPSENMLKSHAKAEKKDMFSEMTAKIMAAAKLPKKEVVAKINKTREKLEVDIEVASLVVARSYGIDISEEIVVLGQRIISGTE